MNGWIFQGHPRRYDIAEKLQEGKTETWLVSRFRSEFNNGDIVFFWKAGDRAMRGIYGWGRVICDEPRHYEGWGWGIDVQYQVRFGDHISIDQIEEADVLSNNLILKMPAGTNFRLTQEELAELCDLIIKRGENAPAIGGEGL